MENKHKMRILAIQVKRVLNHYELSMKNKDQIKVEQLYIKIIYRLNVKNICNKKTNFCKKILIKKLIRNIKKSEIRIWNKLYTIKNNLLY